MYDPHQNPMIQPKIEDFGDADSYAKAMTSWAMLGDRSNQYERAKKEASARSSYSSQWNRWNENRIYGDLNRSGEYRKLASRVGTGLITNEERDLYNRLRDITKRWKIGGRLSDEEIKLLRSYVGTADTIGNTTYYSYD